MARGPVIILGLLGINVAPGLVVVNKPNTTPAVSAVNSISVSVADATALTFTDVSAFT